MFEGNWSDGKRHGNGTLTYKGDIALGHWVNDTLTFLFHDVTAINTTAPNSNPAYSDISRYFEQIQFTPLEPEDTFELKETSIKESVFDDRVLATTILERRVDGSYILEYSIGVTYQGGVKYSFWHGFGRATYPNGHLYREYVGNWKFGVMTGSGKLVWTDERTYSGDWVNGQRHGFGEMNYAINDLDNRASYTGNWKNDMRYNIKNEYQYWLLYLFKYRYNISCIYTYIHTCMHAYIYTYIHTYIHAYIHNM